MDAIERSRQNEQLLRLAGRITRVGGWSADLAHDRVSWSPEIYDILEYEGEEPPALSATLALYPVEWRPHIQRALEETLRTGTPFDLQAEIVTYKGNRLWVRAVGESEPDADGKRTRVVGAFQDLTAAHVADEELRESRERYELATSAAALWEWQSASNAFFISPRLSAMLGYEAGEPKVDLEGFFSMIHEEDRPGVKQALVAHLRDDVPYDVSYRVREKAGTYRWISVTGRVVRDSTGAPLRMAGSVVDIHRRRQAEAEARDLSERLLLTLESITDALLTIDREWRFTYLNPQAQRFLQTDRDALIGRNIFDAFPAARGSEFERQYRRAMDTNETVEFEAYYPEPLNAWYSVRAFPSSQGLAVYFRDITAARAAKERLETSEERFRILSKATNDAIWDWDLITDDVWWNDGYLRLFGYPHEEQDPTSRSWTDKLHPDDADRVLHGIHDAIEGAGEAWTDEYRFRCRDGSYRTVLDRGHVIRDAAGRAIRMVGGMTDLTDRLATDQRLAKQAALIDQASDAIVEFDLDQRVIFWSRGAEEVYGYSAAEAVGKALRELIVDREDSITAALEDVLRDGEWAGELSQIRKNGDAVTAFGRWTVVRDDAGAPLAVLAIETDITERRKIEQQFLRSQRMESIGTLAGGIAHDLNNVLAPILMSIELLRLDETDPERMETLETIEMSARRGAEMVRQVLSFARGVEGQRVDLQLRHLVADVVKIISETFPKNIHIETRIPEDLWTVQADPTQLHQVLVNVAVNARDAMPGGGRLVISAANETFDEQYAGAATDAKAGPHVALAIEDTGSGMSPELLEKIFDPFFTTKEPGRGTGLGLPTCEAIVKSHGGFIRVYSEVGKGTRFRIYLPARPDATAEEVAAVERQLPRGNGEVVLVVDDEPSVRQITRETLEAFGYRVRVAVDGAEAVALYARIADEVDVVLTDMMMPVMDGASTIQVLRKLNPQVRIIAASGLGTDGRVQQVAVAGVRHFLPKPFSADLLLRTIRDVLAEPPSVRLR